MTAPLISNTSIELHPKRSCAARVVHCSLFIAHCSLFILLSACGDKPANTPVIPSLEGERREQSGSQHTAKAGIDLSGAPTAAHRRIGALLPLEALQRSTVLWCGWDGENARLSEDSPAGTPIPAVIAEYLSTGFRIHTDTTNPKGEVRREFPQRANLTLIAAPDNQAAQVLERRLYSALEQRGFAKQESMAMAVSTKEKPEIQRLVRIDPGEAEDKVYVAYVMVIGDLVLYALESETPPVMTAADGSQLERVNDIRHGKRLGAQLIMLIYFRINP